MDPAAGDRAGARVGHTARSRAVIPLCAQTLYTSAAVDFFEAVYVPAARKVILLLQVRAFVCCRSHHGSSRIDRLPSWPA
jgi:hypothetical protein